MVTVQGCNILFEYNMFFGGIYIWLVLISDSYPTHTRHMKCLWASSS